MNLSTKIQIGLLTAGMLLVCGQFKQRQQQSRDLAAIQARVQTETEKFEERRTALAEEEQHHAKLLEAERRAGNQTLIRLMQERAAVTAATKGASDKHDVAHARATVLGDAEQQSIDQEARRNEMRANMGLFFKLVKLSPEKIDQYIDLQIKKESRNANRMSALLRGSMTLEDALRERDKDNQEHEMQQRVVLGTEGATFLESIAEGMRSDEAKRLVNMTKQGMGSYPLDQQQSDRLQGLMKTELVALPLDDTDLFRTPEEWTQIVSERQQNVLQAAATFLSQEQLETIKKLAAFNLAERQKVMMAKRKSLGIK